MRNHLSANKTFPPYGQKLQRLLHQGFTPKNNIFLFLGIKAWEKAKDFDSSHVVLLLPPGRSPYDYQWPVQDCSVLAFDTGGLSAITIEQTAHALLLAGALSVHVIVFNDQLVIYRRD